MRAGSLVELDREAHEPADILVNGIFQDPNDPVTFVSEEETSHLKPGGLIIDISCDEGASLSFRFGADSRTGGRIQVDGSMSCRPIAGSLNIEIQDYASNY